MVVLELEGLVGQLGPRGVWVGAVAMQSLEVRELAVLTLMARAETGSSTYPVMKRANEDEDSW